MKTTIWKSKIRVTLCSLQPTERSPTLQARATYFLAMEVTSQPKIDTSQWFQSAPHGVNHVSRPSAKREALHASNHCVLNTLQRTLRPLPSSPCHRSQKSRPSLADRPNHNFSSGSHQARQSAMMSTLVHFEPNTVRSRQHEQIFRFPIVEKNGSLYSKFSGRFTKSILTEIQGDIVLPPPMTHQLTFGTPKSSVWPSQKPSPRPLTLPQMVFSQSLLLQN